MMIKKKQINNYYLFNKLYRYSYSSQEKVLSLNVYEDIVEILREDFCKISQYRHFLEKFKYD